MDDESFSGSKSRNIETLEVLGLSIISGESRMRPDPERSVG